MIFKRRISDLRIKLESAGLSEKEKVYFLNCYNNPLSRIIYPKRSILRDVEILYRLNRTEEILSNKNIEFFNKINHFRKINYN